MPFEVKLSQIQDRAQYEQAVAEHAERLTAFTREVGKPRPVAHPLVEAAIKRVTYPKADKRPDDYVADYTIVDDTPPPPPPVSLEDRKRMLVAAVHANEAKAKEAIMPQRKLRLLNIKYSQAMATPEQLRTADDEASISGLHDLIKKFQAIELLAAEAESDIEDLTDDTVNSWQPPTFG